MSKIREGYWDCPFCNSKGIKGRFRECPNCSAPRGVDTKFYLGENITYVPNKIAKNISKNPDWLCKYCGSLNSDKDTVCKSCGVERENDNLDYFENKQIQEEKEQNKQISEEEFVKNYQEEITKETETEESTVNLVKSSFHEEPILEETKSFKEKISNFFKLNGTYVLGIIAFILFIGLGIYLIIPKNIEITPVSFQWERNIEIEKYQNVNESDWAMPSKANLHYTKEEIHHYDKVIDHYETITEIKTRQVPSGSHQEVTGTRDLGNGYFEDITTTVTDYTTESYTETSKVPVYKDVPVYQTKYYYDIDKWLYERTVTTKGNDKNYYWGSLNLVNKNNKLETLGNEKESRRIEKYFVTCLNKKNEEKTYKCNKEMFDYLNVSVKQKVKLQLDTISFIEEK